MLLNASDQDVVAPDATLSRIQVNGIGRATPAAAAAIAKGFGLPAEKVVSCLYKAPSILVDSIPGPVAEQICDLLQGTGLDAEIQPQEAPLPAAAPLHDVAIYVHDATATPEIAEVLAAFLGVPPSRAMEMLLCPPGLVLGDVSSATVEALENQLPDDAAELVASRADAARYDLFVMDPAPVVLNALVRDLTAHGREPMGSEGLIATGLDYNLGRTLWRRHQASGAVRLVNQDFQRFDLILRDAPEEADRADLTELAGIPAEMLDMVIANAPITLEEGLRHRDLADRLALYARAGFIVEARMISFQHLALNILDAPDHRETAAAMSSLGLIDTDAPLPRLPYRTEGVMPELQARVTRAALEQTGATVEYVGDDL